MKISKEQIMEAIALALGIYLILFSIEDKVLQNIFIAVYCVGIVLFHFIRVYLKVNKNK